MTRAFWDEKKYSKNIQKIFEAHQSGNKFDTIFSERKDNNAFYAAARLVRFFSAQYVNFKRLMELSYIDSKLSFSLNDALVGCPLIIPTPDDPTCLRVFQNIPLDVVEDDAVSSVCWVFYFNVLETFWQNYKKDQESVRKQGWSPFSRGWRRIRTYEDIPTARVLARYTNLEKKGMVTSAQLRDIAAGIDEQRKPMDIIIAEKPEDYIDMYLSGPSSCMSYGKGDWRWLTDEHKHHPCSFFAYHPYVKGVYALYKGVVCARTMIYQKPDGVWYYGRLYNSNPKFGEKFEQTLKEKGYRWLGSHTDGNNKFRRDATFEIPGLKHGVEHAMPIPYCDNFGPGIKVTWDGIKKVFTVVCSADDMKYNIGYQSQSGFFYAGSLGGRRCSSCAAVENLNNRHHIETPDGQNFCTAAHAQAHGFVWAYRSDANRVWVQNGIAVQDGVTGHWYTNLDVMKQYGAFQAIINLDEEPEDEEEHFTVNGHIVEIDGEKYRLQVSNDTLNAYFMAKKITRGAAMDFIGRQDYIWKLAPTYGSDDLGKPIININKQRTVIIEENETMFA